MENIDDIIIKYSVGIGESFEEAAAALTRAKSADKSRLDNIVAFEGEGLGSKEQKKASNAEHYKRVLRHLRETDAGPDVMQSYKALGEDPRTGLFNKLGYETAMLEMRENGKDIGYYILIDGNNMHDHNSEKGYSTVDNYLEATGKAILEATRSGLDRREPERANPGRRMEDYSEDIVAHRVNDSAGDEFLIYLPLDHATRSIGDARRVAERVLDNIYEKEREVARNIAQEALTKVRP